MRMRQGTLLKNKSPYDTLIDFFKRIKQQKDNGMEFIDNRKLIYDYLKGMKKENVVMYKYYYEDFKKKNKKKLNTTEALMYQWDFIKRQIDVEKDPFLLDLPPGDYYYANQDVGHQVLVLGYRQYDYASKQFDTGLNMSGYLLINDGWSKTGHWNDGDYHTDYTFKDRFINYSSSKIYESWIMTTCHFIGK
ncbi:hypothetical protein [Eubacterium xylanophilum]|uniref:hypothetical protein n=1 Tax=Eubacterium xylanophilum TaxID=39497 RepID=UPI0005543A6A|nr:hypothetical protein [Eubacterium xylanophilum]